MVEYDDEVRMTMVANDNGISTSELEGGKQEEKPIQPTYCGDAEKSKRKKGRSSETLSCICTGDPRYLKQ